MTKREAFISAIEYFNNQDYGDLLSLETSEEVYDELGELVEVEFITSFFDHRQVFRKISFKIDKEVA